jgi:predicted peptidase
MNRSIRLALLTSMLACAGAAPPSTQPSQRRESFRKTITKSIGYDFVVQLPRDYGAREGKTFPLIVFLHGSGECGKNLSKVADHGLPKLAAQKPDFPFILVAPQSRSVKDDWSIESLDALLDHVLATYAGDPDRVYLTGLSMGGYGAWNWACHRPSAFAAIAPIAGEGNTDLADQLRDVPVWAFHGGKDPEVAVTEEERMINEVKRLGGDAKLTIYPDAGHNAWERAYGDPALFEWFLSHRRSK